MVWLVICSEETLARKAVMGGHDSWWGVTLGSVSSFSTQGEGSFWHQAARALVAFLRTWPTLIVLRAVSRLSPPHGPCRGLGHPPWRAECQKKAGGFPPKLSEPQFLFLHLLPLGFEDPFLTESLWCNPLPALFFPVYPTSIDFFPHLIL